uniref:Uncharacterized protein n=1 Tax=viral metagenome TaxID=1070528 RepID=A0A6M3L6K0_9ZZZZ
MKITLNSKQYDIDSMVEKQVSPFTTKIGTPTVEWGNFAPCSVDEYRDLRGGLGLESTEGVTNRFYWADGVETTKEGYLTLGPLVTTAGTFGGYALKIIDFQNATYGLGNSLCKKWNTSTSAWDASHDGTPLTTPTDAIVVTDATDEYLIVCNGANVQMTVDGAAWTTLSTENLKYMCFFDNRLIGVDAAYNKIWYSPRDDIDGTLASFNISGDYSVVTDLFSGKLLTTGEPCIYMLTDTGLYSVDFYTQTIYKMEVRYPYTTKAYVGMYWNGYVYVATGMGIARLTADTVEQWGPDADGGLPNGYQGYVTDMIGIAHWVIIAVAEGTNKSLLKRHESTGGWHQITTSANIKKVVCHSPSSMYSPGRLWFGDSTSIKYVQFPDTTHDITKVTGYEYALSGTLYLPQFSRVSSMPKVAVELTALADDLTASYKATPSYIVNNPISLSDGDWTALSAWTTTPQPSSSFGSSLGVSFYDICFKIVFTRAGTTTSTPVVKSIGFKYVGLPPVVTAWQFVVKGMGDRAKEIITNLETARDTTTLINFSPDGDTNISVKYVKIMSMPSRRELEGHRADQTFTVTVAEVS